MKAAAKSSNPSRIGWIWRQIVNKYMGIEERFVWLVSIVPQRFRRLFGHFIDFKSFPKNKAGENWFFVLLIYTMECFCIPEIYESFSSLFKFNTRPLTESEIALGLSVYGETMDYELVRLDEKALIGPKQGRFCYVSFHTVNSWGKMSASVFIHELMHVWQYERMGAMYIPRALNAQKTEAGYNYGGIDALKENKEVGLAAFNLEQQADIVADYYRIRHGLRPNWGKATLNDLDAYRPYIEEVRSGNYYFTITD